MTQFSTNQNEAPWTDITYQLCPSHGMARHRANKCTACADGMPGSAKPAAASPASSPTPPASPLRRPIVTPAVSPLKQARVVEREAPLPSPASPSLTALAVTWAIRGFWMLYLGGAVAMVLAAWLRN